MRRFLLPVLWTLGILAACSIPGRELPAAPIAGLDKVAHVVLFAGFGWLWARALPARRAAWAGLLGAGLAYAVFTEWYQGLLPLGRSADPYDALADALGLVLGLLLARRR